MIRHGYSGCGSATSTRPVPACSPTMAGRSQAADGHRWGARRPRRRAPRRTWFGLFKLPDWLFLGVSYRGGELVTETGGLWDTRWLTMLVDCGLGCASVARASRASAGLPPPATASASPPGTRTTSCRASCGPDGAGRRGGLVRAGRYELPSRAAQCRAHQLGPLGDPHRHQREPAVLASAPLASDKLRARSGLSWATVSRTSTASAASPGTSRRWSRRRSRWA
jgi:hypothetical protein